MVGTTILVIQIVGMLPYVEGEQGREARTEWIAAVGFLRDVQFAILVGREPGPSRAEEAGGGCCKFFLEVVEAAEVAADGVGQGTFRFVTGRRGGELEEVERVVQYLSGIVEHGAVGGSSHDFFERFAFESRTRHEVVQVVHIGLQMLPVVEVDSGLTDYRFQCVVGIRKCGHVEHHKCCD